MHLPSEFVSARAVASVRLAQLANLLRENSKDRNGRDSAVTFCEATRNSVGSNVSTKSLELKHTIKFIMNETKSYNLGKQLQNKYYDHC